MWAQQVESDEVFGKNRVQYHNDFKYWWMYESPNFITYWYTQARKSAEATILMAEQDYDNIQNMLEHRMNDKIQIVVFKDLTDFKQSNLGSEDVFMIDDKEVKTSANRLYVYFNGDQNNLRQQIREGIAQVHINQMLQGNTIQEYVQNALLNTLPEWYVSGLVSYIGRPWDIDIDNELRDEFSSGLYDDLQEMAEEQPRLAGHALWSYISAKFGVSMVSNLLYITRINRRLESAFLYVLGESLDKVSQDCFNFYKSAYEQEVSNFEDIDQAPIKIKRKKRNKGLQITEVKISPDESQLLYVTNEIGKYKVWLYDLGKKTHQKLFHGEFRNPFQRADRQYPIFNWSPLGDKLFGLYEKRDVLNLLVWDFRNNEQLEQKISPIFERIYSIDYYAPDTLLFSASMDGYTDLFFYFPQRRETFRLTNDHFDNLDAVTYRSQGKKHILFSSNRNFNLLKEIKLDSILPEEQFDLYFLTVGDEKLQQLTNTPWADETMPRQVAMGKYSFLSDRSGVRNIWEAQLNGGVSATKKNKTNYSANIISYDLAGDRLVEVQEKDLLPQLYVHSYQDANPSKVSVTALSMAKQKKLTSIPIVVEVPIQPKEKEERSYFFQTEFDEEIPLPEGLAARENDQEKELTFLSAIAGPGSISSNRSSKVFNPARMLAYRMTFGLTDFDFRMSNEPMFDGLNTFTGFKKGFEYPPVGALMTVEARDLFENYVLTGGARLPLTFDGTEFFVAFEDRKLQLDKKFALYRKSQNDRSDERFEDNPSTRNITHIALAQFNYPLSIFSSLRLTGTLRQDRSVFLPDEQNNLNVDDLYQQRIGLKLEYIFDNSFEVMPNILNGTRAKVYVEGVNRFQLQFAPWTFDANQAFMTVIGLDARHYVRLDKYSIFAARIAGATSLGSEKILYYLGGVRNWIAAQYNDLTPFPAGNNFAYQAAGTEMRGFKQNIRNGSSYALSNVEIRIPIFNYFSKKEVRSKFFRNFQIVGFADAGLAWHGKRPNGEDDPLNSVVIENSVSTVNLRYFRDPIVLGYGAGARFNLLGYFLRLDYAWGLETKIQSDPIFYVSLGYDF
jgi:Tol biopolymer transport system component